MTIKEVEEQLDLPRATIRFYEKEQLVVPQRGKNAYREYSEDDIAALKKIIILRKLGFSVSEIKDFLEENVPLQELLEKNIQELQVKMNELNGAIKICKKMQSRQEDFNSFNESFYWEEIRKQEQSGNKFLEIINDSIEYEKGLILSYYGVIDENGKPLYDKKESKRRIGKYFLVLGILYVIMDGLFSGEWSLINFFCGIRNSIAVVVLISLYRLPWYLLKKKCPDVAREYGKLGYGILATMLTIIGLIVFGFIVFE